MLLVLLYLNATSFLLWYTGQTEKPMTSNVGKNALNRRSFSLKEKSSNKDVMYFGLV